jgi:uncharacterized protein with von Willebrand factor type A (vWA) domain
MSTILMIDTPAILYGEDRINNLPKAMALRSGLPAVIQKDNFRYFGFGNDAWTIEIKDLPYLKVGPFHTNVAAGLQLAMISIWQHNNKFL